LGSPADDQPNRIDVRHGAPADGEDEGERQPVGVSDDGIQADGIGIEEMAAVERLATVSEGDRRGAVCRWGGANQRRLTKPSSTTFDNCSPGSGSKSA